MVGSSDSIAESNTVLNAMAAEAFCEAADELEGAANFEEACKQYIVYTIKAHQRVIFNGDGYSEAWVQEAARRGLPNLRSMVDAIPMLTTEKAVRLFERFGIYTKSELESHAEIMYETYAKELNIEAQTMIHMAGKHYIPAAITYITRLAASVGAVTQACPAADVSVQQELLVHISRLLKQAKEAEDALITAVEEANQTEEASGVAHLFHDEVVPVMTKLRATVDEMELLVDKDIWPVPTYGDLMFEV